MTPSKIEQIESLLNGTACELVERCVAPDRLCSNSYAEVFTVSRREILEYIRKNHNLEEVAKNVPGEEDGFYVVPQGNGYLTYIQERQVRAEQVVVSSENEAWDRYLDYLIGYSGTGLTFE